MIICKNCQTHFEGKYCPECGQLVIHERFTFRKILREFWHILTNVDYGFWQTLKMLLLKPEKLLTDYLQGITRPYQNPFQALFLIAGFSAFIMLQFGLFDQQIAVQGEYIKEMQASELSSGQQQVNAEVVRLLKQYFALVTMLFVPFNATVSFLLFRKKTKYLFSEFLIINTFLMIFPLLVGVIINLLLSVLGFSDHFALISNLNTIITIFYYQYVFKRLYQINWIKSFFLSLLHYVLSTVFFALIIGIIVVINIFFKII